MSKILKEEEASQFTAVNHLSNSAENYLSPNMIRYIEHAVDPKRNPVALRPAPASQYCGLCQKVPVLCRGRFAAGVNGVGSVMVDPFTNLGCQDRALAVFTDATYAGTAATAVPYSAGAGSYPLYPDKAPFTAASISANSDQMISLVNACGLYVKPIGSATTQNGTLFLLEVPGHPGTAAGMTFNDLMNHPRTRLIDAVQLGSPNFQNVLNWHPQNSYNDHENVFEAPVGAFTSLKHAALAVVFVGDAGTSFEFEVYSSYAIRGSLSFPTTPMYVDPLGWAAYLNAIADKRVSGWVGSAGVATSIYKGFAARSVHRQLPKSVHDEQKARALLDREKAKKGQKTGGPPSKTWGELFKEVSPLVKQLGGFALSYL